MKRLIRTIFVLGIILGISAPLYSQSESTHSSEQKAIRAMLIEAMEGIKLSKAQRNKLILQARPQKLIPLDDRSVNIDAGTLLERHIEALGGREALEAIMDRTVRSDISLIRINAANYRDTTRGRKLCISAFPDKQTEISLHVLTRNAPDGYKTDGTNFYQEWSGDRPIGETCEFKQPVLEDCHPDAQRYIHEMVLSCIYDNGTGVGRSYAISNHETFDIDNAIDDILNDPRDRLPERYYLPLYPNRSDEERLFLAPFNEVVRIKELGYKTRIIGKELFDVSMAYKLEVRYGTATEVWIIDCKSYMKLAEYSTSNEYQPRRTRYYDYREVDGVMLPHSISYTDPTDYTATIEDVESYRHNTNPSERVFSYLK